jgi:two-component system, NtrC family, sensor kinase
MVGRNDPYVVSILILLAAAPLAWSGGLPFAAGAAILAGISFLQARATLAQVRKAEQENKALEEQIYRIEKLSAVDELSAGIAHEINNPLAIIAQEAQWMEHLFKGEPLKGLKEIDDCRDSLKEIVTQVGRSKEIVQKLLSFARDMEPVIQSVNMNDLVSDMSRILEGEIESKNIRITKNLQPDLPLAYSDPPLLRQVILNLLVNASHAIGRDGEICVATRVPERNAVEITISDTGCGIPKENIEKIFTPFFSTKLQGKGTGMGLAICRGIIERLGGNISVASGVGKGATFTIYIPINRTKQGEGSHAS